MSSSYEAVGALPPVILQSIPVPSFYIIPFSFVAQPLLEVEPMNSYFGDVKQSSPDLVMVPYTHIKCPLKPGRVWL